MINKNLPCSELVVLVVLVDSFELDTSARFSILRAFGIGFCLTDSDSEIDASRMSSGVNGGGKDDEVVVSIDVSLE